MGVHTRRRLILTARRRRWPCHCRERRGEPKLKRLSPGERVIHRFVPGKLLVESVKITATNWLAKRFMLGAMLSLFEEHTHVDFQTHLAGGSRNRTVGDGRLLVGPRRAAARSASGERT